MLLFCSISLPLGIPCISDTIVVKYYYLDCFGKRKKKKKKKKKKMGHWKKEIMNVKQILTNPITVMTSKWDRKKYGLEFLG